jgi:hypothetical protein
MVMTLSIMLAIAMAGVLVVLFFGIGSMAKGGEFNRRNANRLMRARVVLQLVALILFVLLVLALRA